MNKKNIIFGIVAFIFVAIIVLLAGGVGKNNAQNWQHIQYLSGTIEIKDTAGLYFRKFATVTTYPREMQVVYNNEASEGDKPLQAIKVTFNDGGTANIGTTVRFRTPIGENERKKFHQQFSGNMKNAIMSVKAHLTTVLKGTAPVMSASANQSARKAEFNTIIEKQVSLGRYQTQRVKVALDGRFDEKGDPIMVEATKIITDSNGLPLIAQISPLEQYGLEISQCSITSTEYDGETRRQFAAKKQSFLAAEKSKAQREQEEQEKLMVIARGEKEKAIITAEANKVKEKATIEAQQKVDVAQKAKAEMEMKANMALEVARIYKEEQLTIAGRKLEVATIEALASIEDAKAIVALAEANEKKIKLAGAITEKERILAEIMAEKEVKIALALANVKVPGIMFIGGSESSQSDSIMKNMINLRLIQGAGLIPENKSVSTK